MNGMSYFGHARTMIGMPHSIPCSHMVKGEPASQDFLNLHMHNWTPPRGLSNCSFSSILECQVSCLER